MMSYKVTVECIYDDGLSKHTESNSWHATNWINLIRAAIFFFQTRTGEEFKL